MNRIKLGPSAHLPLSVLPSSRSELVQGYSPSRPEVEPSFFLPLHYEKNYAYPLVVWLHPEGNNEHHLRRVMPRIDTRNYVAVSVRGPARHEHLGYSWPQTASAIETATADVHRAIESVKQHCNIADNRIFLMGQQSGGTMAMRIAFANPETFAAVASLGGPVPERLRPLANLNRCRHLPVFWAHVRKNSQFPERQLCRGLRLLHIAGFSLTLRQYPGTTRLPDQTFSDLNTWMMDQIQATSASRSIVQ